MPSSWSKLLCAKSWLGMTCQLDPVRPPKPRAPVATSASTLPLNMLTAYTTESADRISHRVGVLLLSGPSAARDLSPDDSPRNPRSRARPPRDPRGREG